jgi:nickel/cobalt transporter (NicO) family protein
MFTSAVQFGLLLGLRHAADADHVCTIACLLRAGQGRRQALTTAIVWGLGHSVSFFAVGFSLVLFDIHLPSAAEELVNFAVAVLLVWLGVSQWRHAACVAPHAAVRGPQRLLLGLIHGLAGSAGVALLALAAHQDRLSAAIYLAFFGAGTVLGMVFVTLALSWPLQLAERFVGRWRILFIRLAASASISVGLWLFVSHHLSLQGTLR